MLRFIFYLLFGYVLIKLFRVFIDPLFQQRTTQPSPSKINNGSTEKKVTIGEYVDYEEVK
jgi:hypothetical protein